MCLSIGKNIGLFTTAGLVIEWNCILDFFLRVCVCLTIFDGITAAFWAKVDCGVTMADDAAADDDDAAEKDALPEVAALTPQLAEVASTVDLIVAVDGRIVVVVGFVCRKNLVTSSMMSSASSSSSLSTASSCVFLKLKGEADLSMLTTGLEVTCRRPAPALSLPPPPPPPPPPPLPPFLRIETGVFFESMAPVRDKGKSDETDAEAFEAEDECRDASSTSSTS